MEKEILKELKAINMQIQGFDAKLKEQKNEICTEFDAKLEKLNKEICIEFDAKLKKLNKQIFTEFNIKLNVLERKIFDDIELAFKENMNCLNDTKNKEQNEIIEELRDHKVRTLKGVRAFERALTV